MMDKKTLIYNAVLDIIKERGFSSKIRISDIADKANIGKGTVYEYFDNKDEILAGAIISFIDKMMEQILYSNDGTELDFRESLTRFIDKSFDTFKNNHNIQSLFMSQNIGSILSFEMKMKIMSRLQEVKKAYGEVFEGIVKKGIDEGILKDDIDDFIIAAAKVIIMPSIMEFIRISKVRNDFSAEEFKEKLYYIVVKILS